jgi:hypothetical protein
MRVVAVVAFSISSLVAARLAAADGAGTGGGYEAGYLWTHFDNTTIPGGWNLNGTLVRASAYAASHGHVYVAAELDVGWLNGTGVPNAGVPVQTTARTTDATATTTTTTEGTGATVGRLIQAKVVGGWRTLRGPVGFAVEVAGGVRDVQIGDNRFWSSTSSQTDAIVEARGRAYVWLGRGVTLGAIAGVNIVQRDNVTLGVMLGVHLPR